MKFSSNVEQNFPRGGEGGIKMSRKKTFVFEKQHKKKKIKLGKRERNRLKLSQGDEQKSEDRSSVQQIARYRTVFHKLVNCSPNGTKSIFCIGKVQQDGVIGCLPGGLSARVDKEHLEQFFRKLLKKNNVSTCLPDLNMVLQRGAQIACSLVSLERLEPKGYQWTVSIDPADVNDSFTYPMVQAGDKLWGAVQSVEDHGFTLYTGIPGLVTFLPNKSVSLQNGGEEKNVPDLKVGSILFFMVKKFTENEIGKTIEVTVNPNELYETVLKNTVVLDKLIPGTKVNVTITKEFTSGLAVRVPDSPIQGFIDERYLSSLWSLVSDYPIGSILEAWVLCKFGFDEYPHFSLKPLTSILPIKHLGIGTIREAEVYNYTFDNNIILKIEHEGKYHKGYVSKDKLDDKNEISETYPKGKKVKCRLLYYDNMGETYFCTMKKDNLEIKYYSHLDLSLGTMVDVCITKHTNSGCEGMVGNIEVKIPTLHLADYEVKNVQQKFPLNSVHKGKVLQNRKLPIITLRQTLLSNPALVFFYKFVDSNGENLSHIKFGDSFYGIVSHVDENKISVSFYGNLEENITRDKLPQKSTHYKIGQLVLCFVSRDREKGTPIVSLLPQEKLLVGKRYNLQVDSVLETGLNVKVNMKSLKMAATIPLHHLSDHYHLCEHLLKLYKPGSKIPGAVCYYLDQESPIFSLKASVKKFFDENEDLEGIESIPVGLQIPCTVVDKYSVGALLMIPVRGFDVLLFEKNKLLYEEDQVPYKLNQGVLAKVLSSVKDVSFSGQIKLSCIQSEVTIEENWAVNNLQSYLRELSSVSPVIPGKNMKCRIIEIKRKCQKLKVGFRNGLKGVVQVLNRRQVFTKEQRIQPTVLFYDTVKKYVSMVLGGPYINHKQSKLRKLKQKHKVWCSILGGNDYFLIAVITSLLGKGQFIYFPTQLHPNATSPSMTLGDVDLSKSYEAVIERNGDILIGKLTHETILTKRDKTDNSSNIDDIEMKSEDDSDSLSNAEASDLSFKIENETLESVNSNLEQDDCPELNEESDEISVISEVDSNEENSEDETCHELNEESDEISIKSEVVSNEENSDDETCIELNEETEERSIKSELSDEENSEDEETQIVKKNLSKENKKKNEAGSKKSKKTNSPNLVNESTKSILNNKEKIKTETVELKNVRSELKKKELKRERTSSLTQYDIKKKKIEDVKNLSLEDAGSYFWDATPEDLAKVVSVSSNTEDMKQESDDEVEVEEKKKLTHAERRALAKEKESEIREKELELLEIENNPKSALHFDRLLLSSPNDSMLWIKYMAYHLQGTEIEKARSVAKRALKTINIREEDERLNVWISLLNLENLYGTPETFKESLSEALRVNDDYKVYTKVLDMYVDTEKQVELEQLVNTMVRKFRSNQQCWLNCMTALMKSDLPEKARHYLQRALSCLPNKQHVTLISKFALIENKHGHSEEAQALFENILTSYPARIDIWSVYVDMLIKSSLVDLARKVLERAAGQSLPARKMKTIYTKWLTFEEAYGNIDSVKKVKEAALEYVNNITNSEES